MLVRLSSTSFRSQRQPKSSAVSVAGFWSKSSKPRAYPVYGASKADIGPIRLYTITLHSCLKLEVLQRLFLHRMGRLKPSHYPSRDVLFCLTTVASCQRSVSTFRLTYRKARAESIVARSEKLDGVVEARCDIIMVELIRDTYVHSPKEA